MTLYEYIDAVLAYSPEKYLSDLKTELEADQDIPGIQKKQWEKGQDSEGRIIGTYSKLTEEITGGRKKAGDPYTLFDTGDLYKKTKVLIDEKNNDIYYSVDSDSPHKNELFEFFERNSSSISGFNPEDIFGIQKENNDHVIDVVQEKCITLLKNNFKL